MLFLVIGNLILLNLFLGILLRSIKIMNENEKIAQEKAAINALEAAENQEINKQEN